MKKTAFREYDIRGIVGLDFIPSDVVQLGQAFGSLLINESKKRVVVGRDGRISSPQLAEAFITGLLYSGMSVLDCGLIPTPLLYYSAYQSGAEGAVMVTASHNPPHFNGFKLMLGTQPLCGEKLEKLYDSMINEKFSLEKGNLKTIDYTVSYLQFLHKDFQENYRDSSLKVVWDPGNGVTSPILQKLLPQLPGTHFLINEVVEGTFPSRPSDPTIFENLKQLSQVIQDKKCDFGIAFDGDGDRLSVIDKYGRLLLADQLLPLFAEEVLKTYPDAPILIDVKSSVHLLNSIEKLGGKPLFCSCGHSNIKIKMKEVNSPLAAEMSGHIMFADRALGFDDAIYAAVRLFGILSTMNMPLEEWVDKQSKRFISQLCKIPTTKKFELVELLKKRMIKLRKSFLSIDGIRFETKEGWWLVRASNTEECIVCRVEGKTHKDLYDLVKNLIEMLQQIGLKEAIESEQLNLRAP